MGIQVLIVPESESEQQVGYENVTTVIPAGSIWYENNLISTAPANFLYLPENSDYEGLRIDGWVGPLQKVDRYTHDQPTEHPAADRVNGLEGMVTTVLDHSEGPRRWFSGITGKNEYGVGVDTKTYADNPSDTGRHFMHLSFFAPGKDLHDGNFVFSTPATYGSGAFMNNLQGIWGGGVFTGETQAERFGDTPGDENMYMHLAMEGNYDDNLNYLPETPGPGVVYG